VTFDGVTLYEGLISGYEVTLTTKSADSNFKIDVSWHGGLDKGEANKSDYTWNAATAFYLSQTIASGSATQLQATSADKRNVGISPVCTSFPGHSNTNTDDYLLSTHFTYISADPDYSVGEDIKFQLGARTPYINSATNLKLYTNRTVSDTDAEETVRAVSSIIVTEIKS
jgi:hypothetical protein